MKLDRCPQEYYSSQRGVRGKIKKVSGCDVKNTTPQVIIELVYKIHTFPLHYKMTPAQQRSKTNHQLLCQLKVCQSQHVGSYIFSCTTGT